MPELAATAFGFIRRVYVWDLPVRLFHWALAGLMITLYVTAELMDDAIETHALAGYGVLILVLFRLLWGFVGGSHARFRDFVRGPVTALRYAGALFSTRPPFVPGHNPLGGWMVLALLAALLTQAGLGLFSNDDILFDGPLRDLVSKEVSDRLTGLHHDLFYVLAAMIGLHIAAVVFHRLKGESLTPALFTGYKTLPDGEWAEDARGGSLLLGLVLLLACAGLVYWVVTQM